MKTFKSFVEESKKTSFISIPSFAEIREKRRQSNDWKNNPIMFPSSFGELRDKNLSKGDHHLGESVSQSTNDSTNWLKTQHDLGYSRGMNVHRALYNKNFHEHPGIAPLGLTPRHVEMINHYCSTPSDDKQNGAYSSPNMNARARSLAGQPNQTIRGGHSPEAVDKARKEFATIFTHENTNRDDTTTWGGLPHHIGNALLAAGRSEFHNPGAASTTCSPHVAYRFGSDYLYDLKGAAYKQFGRGPVHIAQYTVLGSKGDKSKRGAGMAVGHKSFYDEDEMIIPPGSRMEHTHSEEKSCIDPDTGTKRSIMLHHITVHPESKEI